MVISISLELAIVVDHPLTKTRVRVMDAMVGFDRDTFDRARLSRDARFDGKFFVAVETTRVYCRPVCPSSCRSWNVMYYATATAAGEAGFRPCRRCRPEAAPGTPGWLGTRALVRRALRLIHDGFLDRASVDALATTLGVGLRHLHRLFLRHLGGSPLAVAQARRVQLAKRLIDETEIPMIEVALAAGFGSPRRFNDGVRKIYGRAPKDLRKLRGRGVPVESGEIALRLPFRSPYDWSQMLESLAVSAIPGVERIHGITYSRTVAAGSGYAFIRVTRVEGAAAFELRVSGATPEDLYHISATARRVFDLATDPERIATAFQTDRLLFRLVTERPGLRIPGVWDPFECAVRAILSQRLGVPAAQALTARVVGLAGRRVPVVVNGSSHLFPSPEALATMDLAGAGIPCARGEAVVALARAVMDEKIDFGAPVHEVTAAIAALPGCGPWIAQHVALCALGDPDAFPAGDLVLRRMANNGGEPLSASDLERRAEAWRPWRGYAALHLWRAAAQGRVGQEARRNSMIQFVSQVLPASGE